MCFTQVHNVIQTQRFFLATSNCYQHPTGTMYLVWMRLTPAETCQLWLLFKSSWNIRRVLCSKRVSSGTVLVFNNQHCSFVPCKRVLSSVHSTFDCHSSSSTIGSRTVTWWTRVQPPYFAWPLSLYLLLMWLRFRSCDCCLSSNFLARLSDANISHLSFMSHKSSWSKTMLCSTKNPVVSLEVVVE